MLAVTGALLSATMTILQDFAFPSLFIFIGPHLKAAVLVSSQQRFCTRMGHSKKKKAGKLVVVAD